MEDLKWQDVKSLFHIMIEEIKKNADAKGEEKFVGLWTKVLHGFMNCLPEMQYALKGDEELLPSQVGKIFERVATPSNVLFTRTTVDVGTQVLIQPKNKEWPKVGVVHDYMLKQAKFTFEKMLTEIDKIADVDNKRSVAAFWLKVIESMKPSMPSLIELCTQSDNIATRRIGDFFENALHPSKASLINKIVKNSIKGIRKDVVARKPTDLKKNAKGKPALPKSEAYGRPRDAAGAPKARGRNTVINKTAEKELPQAGLTPIMEDIADAMAVVPLSPLPDDTFTLIPRVNNSENQAKTNQNALDGSSPSNKSNDVRLSASIRILIGGRDSDVEFDEDEEDELPKKVKFLIGGLGNEESSEDENSDAVSSLPIVPRKILMLMGGVGTDSETDSDTEAIPEPKKKPKRKMAVKRLVRKASAKAVEPSVKPRLSKKNMTPEQVAKYFRFICDNENCDKRFSTVKIMKRHLKTCVHRR